MAVYASEELKAEISTSKANFSLSFIISRLLLTVVALFTFLVSLSVLGNSLKLLSETVIGDIIAAIANPFVGLFVGLLATAIIQKSAMVTSMSVAMVAAGTLSLTNAVPIVIGANIGTTITAVLVSFAHITRRKEFRRATSTAMAHNLFNVFAATLLFPLEYLTHFLSHLSMQITLWLKPVGEALDLGIHGIIDLTIYPLAEFIVHFANNNVWLLLPLSLIILFVSISSFTLILKGLLMGERWHRLQDFVFGTPLKSLLSGVFLTAGLQSSSLTTSVSVTLVSTRKVSLKKAFPFIMGANIGTTFTALLAAVSQSDAALSIAIVHLIFNTLGVLLMFPIPAIRQSIVHLAQLIGRLAMQNRFLGVLYVIFIFFLIPFALILFSKL